MEIDMNVSENLSRKIEAALAASINAHVSAGTLLRDLIETAGGIEQLAAKGERYCESFGVRANYDEDNLSEDTIIIRWGFDDVTHCTLEDVILACHNDSLPNWFESEWVTGAPIPDDDFDAYLAPEDVTYFEGYGTGDPIVSMRYSYSEKEMTLTRTWHENDRRRGRDTVTIDNDQLDELQSMFSNNFIGPSYVFNAACGPQPNEWGR